MRNKIRQIEQLAHGFFRGPESFRAEILQGSTDQVVSSLVNKIKELDLYPSELILHIIIKELIL